MNRDKRAIVILLVAIVIGTSLRFAAAAHKHGISHDEAISCLAATGHQGEYKHKSNKTLAGRWVPASAWKRFIRIEKPFCFKQIGHDLAHYDLHPPLYFWLLHLWFLIFGANLEAALVLNIFLAILTALSLFILACYTLNNSVEAALVVFIWYLSWSVVTVSLIIRHYDLFVLIVVLFVGQIIKSVDLARQFKIREFSLLAVLTAAIALTHYLFLLVVAGGIVFSIVKLIKKNKPRLMREFASLGTGCIMFFVLHSHFYLAFPYQQAYTQPFSYGEFIYRIKIAVFSLMNFWGVDHLKRAEHIGFFFGAGLIILLFFWFKKRPKVIDYIRKTNFTGFYILYFFLWIAGATVLLYISFLTSRWHMGRPRYLSAAWPFYAFLPIFLLRFCGKFRVFLTVLLCFILLALGCQKTRNYINYSNKMFNPIPLLENSDRVVIDNLKRGVLPCLFWHIPDDKLIFAASQDYLLSHPNLWLSDLSNRSIYISSHLGYESAPDRVREILALINQKYNIVQVKGGIWGQGDAFIIQKNKPR